MHSHRGITNQNIPHTLTVIIATTEHNCGEDGALFTRAENCGGGSCDFCKAVELVGVILHFGFHTRLPSWSILCIAENGLYASIPHIYTAGSYVHEAKMEKAFVEHMN